MPRRPHDLANINLRIRESLRAKIEREARKRHFSLNNEIRIRLEDSLNRDAMRTLDDIAQDMQIVWARFSNRATLLSLQDQLGDALAKTADPEVSKLARLWLQHRELERRLLTAGAVS
jgi:Arc-like DNA binding domain